MFLSVIVAQFASMLLPRLSITLLKLALNDWIEIWSIWKVENVLFSFPPLLRYDNNPICWLVGLNCIPVVGLQSCLWICIVLSETWELLKQIDLLWGFLNRWTTSGCLWLHSLLNLQYFMLSLLQMKNYHLLNPSWVPLYLIFFLCHHFPVGINFV